MRFDELGMSSTLLMPALHVECRLESKFLSLRDLREQNATFKSTSVSTPSPGTPSTASAESGDVTAVNEKKKKGGRTHGQIHSSPFNSYVD